MDILQILEGATYAAFIVGAIVAIYELRTMARDRQTEFILRVNEYCSTKEFEEAAEHLLDIDTKDPRKIEEVCTRQALHRVVGYMDGIGDLARLGLLKKELVLDMFTWDEMWDKLEPWIVDLRQRHSNNRMMSGFEYAGAETRRWRAGLKESG